MTFLSLPVICSALTSRSRHWNGEWCYPPFLNSKTQAKISFFPFLSRIHVDTVKRFCNYCFLFGFVVIHILYRVWMCWSVLTCWCALVCFDKLHIVIFFAKDCLLTVVKGRLALGSPGCLFVRLFVRHHAENGPIHRKIVFDCPLVIISKAKLFFRPDSQSFA